MNGSSGINCPSCKQIRKKTNNNVTQSQNNDSSIPEESQSHLIADCLAFDEPSDNYDLSQDDQIVKYFEEVFSRRDQFEGVEDDED